MRGLIMNPAQIQGLAGQLTGMTAASNVLSGKVANLERTSSKMTELLHLLGTKQENIGKMYHTASGNTPIQHKFETLKQRIIALE